MGSNSRWEMTGRQEGEGKSQFSALYSSMWCSGNSPATADTTLLWKYTGKRFTGVALCMLSECWRCLYWMHTLKKLEKSLSWPNAQHFFLDGRHRARWWRVRGRHAYHLQTRSTIIDRGNALWYWVIQQHLSMMNKSSCCILKCSR